MGQSQTPKTRLANSPAREDLRYVVCQAERQDNHSNVVATAVVLFGFGVPLIVDTSQARAGSVFPTAQSPSWEHWSGTTAEARELLHSFLDTLIGVIVAIEIFQYLLNSLPDIFTLSNIIHWQDSHNAVIPGMWWGSPIVILVILFAGLFIASIGLYEWANPRLRRRG